MGDGGWREGRLWGMVGGGRGVCGGWWVEGRVSVGDGGWRVGCLWGMVGGGRVNRGSLKILTLPRVRVDVL